MRLVEGHKRARWISDRKEASRRIMSLMLAIPLVECTMSREPAIETLTLCAGNAASRANRDSNEDLGEKRKKREKREGERRESCVCRRPDSKHLACSQCNNAFNGALSPWDIQLNQEAALYLVWRNLTRHAGSTAFAWLHLYKDSRHSSSKSQQPTNVEGALAPDHDHAGSRPQRCKASEEAF